MMDLKYRDQYVYPGHPMVIAVIIMDVYARFHDANTPTEHNWCHALGNSKIPGAGGNVAATMDLLRFVENKALDVDGAVQWAKDYWKRCVGPGTGNHERQFKSGVDGAAAIEATFRTRLSEWDFEPRKPATPSS